MRAGKRGGVDNQELHRDLESGLWIARIYSGRLS